MQLMSQAGDLITFLLNQCKSAYIKAYSNKMNFFCLSNKKSFSILLVLSSHISMAFWL